MTGEIYSRKRLARIVGILGIVLCVGMLISFRQRIAQEMAGARSSTLIFGIVEGSVLAFILVYLYGAFRLIWPRQVEGRLLKANGNFVNRERNNLVIRVDEKRYKFPLDSGVSAKLDDVSADALQVRMEVGAFNYALSLELTVGPG